VPTFFFFFFFISPINPTSENTVQCSACTDNLVYVQICFPIAFVQARWPWLILSVGLFANVSCWVYFQEFLHSQQGEVAVLAVAISLLP